MDFDNITLTSCPPPFLNQDHYPKTGGYIAGRYCGELGGSGLSCCVPCPLEDWVYTDNFECAAEVARWFNVLGLIAQAFLLLTFVVLPPEKGHGHYLSIGLCVCLSLLQLSFIVPLGTRPDMCYDAVTPDDYRSDVGCGWTGGLLLFGAMGGVSWILLRSLYTHLHVCYSLLRPNLFFWLAQLFGWGIPSFFLAISLPITGVSYRLSTTCIPNEEYAFITWFGWLIAFAGLAAILQFATTGFCLWVYARNWFERPNMGVKEMDGTAGSSGKGTARGSVVIRSSVVGSQGTGRRMAWRRVQRILIAQWRSIVLSLMVIVETAFFGTVFVLETHAALEKKSAENQDELAQWAICLVLNGGDKYQCLDIVATVFGLTEAVIIAALVMTAIIGILTALLMVRASMFVGWYELLRHPIKNRHGRSGSDGDFILIPPKRRSLGRQLESERTSNAPDSPTKNEIRPAMLAPEAGNVSERHPTTTLFDEDEMEEALVKESREAV